MGKTREIATTLKATLGGYKGSSIFTYHKIYSSEDKYFRDGMIIDIETLERQIRFLRDRYKIISLRSLIKMIKANKLIDRYVCITFDDGYSDNYRYAYPILKKYSCPATIFLTTDPVDHGVPLWWDRIDGIIADTFSRDDFLSLTDRSPIASFSRYKNRNSIVNAAVDHVNQLDKESRGGFWHEFDQWVSFCGIKEPVSPMLNWDMVREMSKNGIDFECHTRSHAFVDEMSLSDMENELIGSRDRIREMINQPADILACPRGRIMNDEQIRFIQSNFLAVCTTNLGFVDKNSELYSLNRRDSRYLNYKGNFNKIKATLELSGVLDVLR